MSPPDEPVPGALGAETPPDTTPAHAVPAAPTATATLEPEEVAPPVVAVMVAHDPGPWWEDVLASIAQQTYENLTVLVVDTASEQPLDGRLLAVLPDAHVHRLEENPGFGPAANEALGAVQGAAFLLVCHDDVVLDPGAVQAMVEEAFRSNAGVVGPKVVEWDDPDRLLQVGMGADKFGAPAPYLERGELDQEQHDAVRDVFYVPGGAMLVRADLFATLGGFDPGIDLLGEDLDFCWRAHVAGARVLVAPAATIAHREALEERRPTDDRRRLLFRHHLRTTLICYNRPHRWRVLPQAFVLAVVEAVSSLLLGRLGHARDVVAAWTATLGDLGDIRARRRELRTVRRVRDKEIRPLQARGSARATAFLRSQLGSNDDRIGSMAGAGRDLAASLRTPTARLSLVAWGLVLFVLVVGSRDLLTHPVPSVGELVPFPSQPSDLFGQWISGYHDAGLGSEAANPTNLGFLGALGTIFFGAMGQLRRVLVVALLPLGALGMWRLARPIGSRRSRIVALVVYTAIPVGSNALSHGGWSGLATYALAPWIVNQLVRASKLAPFGAVGDEPGPGVVDRPLLQRVIILGFLIALGMMIVPLTPAIAVGTALALAVGGIVVGQVRGVVRLVGVAVLGSVLAIVLHLPWSLELLDPQWNVVAGTAAQPVPALDLDQILRFATGPDGPGPLGWAVLVAGVLALVIGKRWRLAWATRGWMLAIAGWGLVWVASEGWLTGYLPAPEVLLAPAAVGIALAAAMGMAAFEVDLPDYHFGWRQIVSLGAGAAVLVAIVPLLQTSLDGSWGLPKNDFTSLLEHLDAPSAEFRSLWIGDVTVMPMNGWKLDAPGIEEHGRGHQLVYATTDGQLPSVPNVLPGLDDGATVQLERAIQDAASGQTHRLGVLLAPMGIQYIIVPQATGPLEGGTTNDPDALLDVLAGQLDLELVELPQGITVYRNRAWGPVTARLPADTAVPPQGGPSIDDRVVPAITGAPDALPDRTGYTSAQGQLDGPAVVYVGKAADDRWILTVNGAPAQRGPALGWANQYRTDATGQAALTFQTSKKRYAALGAVTLLWVLALWYLWHTRVAKEAEIDLAHVREGYDG